MGKILDTNRIQAWSRPVRVGVIGTGFVCANFVREAARRGNYNISKVLTRRPLEQWLGFSRDDVLTSDVNALIDHSDIVFQSTGDPVYAASVIGRILSAGKPVVTLDSEFHVTVGSYYLDRGLVTEAEGDQPGCLAALREEADAIGLQPLVYGNLKGFLNRRPDPQDMAYWAERQGYRLDKVVSFTDGTKLQIEQCLIANGLGATIAVEGLMGLETADIEDGAQVLALRAEKIGRPIADYILDRQFPHAVFICGRHDAAQAGALRNYKMGDGPYYVMRKQQCLGHLEVFKTIDRVLLQGRGLLDNGHTPEISVAAVAKRALRPGDRIAVGIGSFDLRGICIRICDHPGHLPIGLASGLTITRGVEAGAILNFEDVDIAHSEAVEAWVAIRQQMITPEAAAS